MRAYLAAVIALSVCSLQAHALAFHVHAASAEQVRGERHRHAPAIHHHHNNRTGYLWLSDDDGNAHTITLTVPAATSSDSPSMHALPVEVLSFTQPDLMARMPAIELHSHGPPVARDSRLRGPPPLTLL